MGGNDDDISKKTSNCTIISNDNPGNVVLNGSNYEEWARGIIHCEILTKLPTKSLLRFKCVSKDWYNLISSPSFHRKHASVSNEIFILFKGRGVGLRRCFMCLVDPSGTTTVVKNFLQLYNVGLNLGDIQGSCNGLICISYGGFIAEEIALCNPITREYRRLADLPRSDLFNSCYDQFGFGYDILCDDYKIVRIIRSFLNPDSVVQVYIYSTRNNSWKEVVKVPRELPRLPLVSVFANNKLHWIADKETNLGKKNSVLTFDLHTEEFGEISLPTKIQDYSSRLMASTRCFYIVTGDVEECDNVSIWVMKDYGISKSWTELCTIVKKDVPYKSFRVVAYQSSGEDRKVLLYINNSTDLQTPYELVWYNIKDKSIRKVNVRDKFEYVGYEWMCTASLMHNQLRKVYDTIS